MTKNPVNITLEKREEITKVHYELNNNSPNDECVKKKETECKGETKGKINHINKNSNDLNISDNPSDNDVDMNNSKDNDSSKDNDNSNDDDDDYCDASYETLVELKRKIHYLEKKLLQKKRAEVKNTINNKEITKPLYRSFDEFYEYRKNYEEQQNKIKNETWKSLNKIRIVIKNEEVEKPKEYEKYSYIKLKSERNGTVKQLKEYFQKMEQEKREKRKNALIIKKASKSTNHFKNVDKECKKTYEENNENNNEKNNENNNEKNNKESLETKMVNTQLKTVPVNTSDVEKISGHSQNKCPESICNNTENAGSYNTTSSDKYNDKCKNVEKREIVEEEKEKEKEKREEKQKITEKEKEREKQSGTNSQNSENISANEIELLLKLIGEMKKNCERDETYILSLIKELQNSRKHLMIEKLVDLLKIFKKKKEEETTQKESLTLNNNNNGENKNLSTENETVINLTHYDNKLKEIEMRIKNIESRNEAAVKVKETNDDSNNGMKIGATNEKEITSTLTSTSFQNEKNTCTDPNKKDSIIINDIGDGSFFNSNRNSTSEKLKKRNKKKSNNNKNKKKIFDWFYKSINNLSDEDMQMFNVENIPHIVEGGRRDSDEGNGSGNDIEDNMNIGKIDRDINYYPSDESAQADGNDDMFSWLKEKDVEFVLSQKKEPAD